MPIIVSNETYLRTMDVCKIVGISRATLLRWLKEGTFKEPICRDRRGWRLFTQAEVNSLKMEAQRISRRVE